MLIIIPQDEWRITFYGVSENINDWVGLKGNCKANIYISSYKNKSYQDIRTQYL